jgi:hypothetical protein
LFDFFCVCRPQIPSNYVEEIQGDCLEAEVSVS